MGGIFSSSFGSDGEHTTCGSIDARIEKLIYSPPVGRTEKDIQSCYNSVRDHHHKLTTNNNRIISVMECSPPNKSSKYIIFSHGNAGDIFSYSCYIKYLVRELNVNVVIYDYIGFGLFEPINPTEKRCYQSLDTVMNYFINERKIDKQDLFLIGQSLGTGIVVDCVSKHDWTTPIMLISPYKTIPKVVMDTSCTRPIEKFDTWSKISKVMCPVKIVHGTHDEVINVKHGKTLHGCLKNKALEPLWMDNCGHNDILDRIPTSCYLDVINYSG